MVQIISTSQGAADEGGYVIGTDRDGCWLAVETHGRGGGIFRDPAAAARFVAGETDHRPGAVAFVSGILSLDFGRVARAAAPVR